MSYVINNSRGQIVAVVADGTVNTTATDLALVGRGLTDYGEYENENYVYLLENFANSTAPTSAITGQLWYNTTTDSLSSYTNANTWQTLASVSYVDAQKISPALTGIPTAPTAAAGTSSTQLATTAFVTQSPQFLGVPTAPTATAGTSSTQLATTAFVTQSPQFLGVPTAPTAAAGTSSTQLATTAFVSSGPQFLGTPTAPTRLATDNSTFLATTEFVQAQKISPNFSGVPTAPTAIPGTANTQIASTAFVTNRINALGSMATQNANSVSITGGLIQGLEDPLAIADGGTGARNSTDARNFLGLGDIATQNANSINISGGSISGITPIGVVSGGTGASTAAAARDNLELGSMATQNANAVSITGGSIVGIAALMIENGGTGATDAVQARFNLGLGDVATQSKNAVDITGGTITGITPLPVASGGTAANNATNARINLGLGTMATQNANDVAITGGSISGLTTMIPITSGGTGANSAANARINLGLGSISTQAANNIAVTGGTITGVVSNAAGLSLGTLADQNANAVSITGGSISGISALPVASGGTGSGVASTARTNLGLAIGTNVQAYSSVLQAMSNTIPGTDTMIYFTSANTAAVTTITEYGRQVLQSTSPGLGLGTMSDQNANAVAITGGSISGLANALAVADGGTGGINAFQARLNLGLGTVSTQNANAVAITGGSITGITDLAVADGGTGASTASDARINLGLGTMATQNANAVTMTGTPTAPTATVTTNSTQIATTQFVQNVALNVIPTGVITMWYGSIASIPVGWYLCNGANGTPNLQDRFIVGAGSIYAVNATGGSADASLVAHDHLATSTFTGAALGNHTHTATDSGHVHSYSLPNSANPQSGSSTLCLYPSFSLSSTTVGKANISVTSNSAGTPSGTVSTTVDFMGQDATGRNLPPYYALAYIMKA